MVSASAVIFEFTQSSGRHPGDVKTVTALGLGPEVFHDRPPLGSMGTDARSVAGEGDQVCHLMGDRLGQEVIRVLAEQDWVVADHPGLPPAKSDLAGGPPPEVESDFRHGHPDIQPVGDLTQELAGSIDREFLRCAAMGSVADHSEETGEGEPRTPALGMSDEQIQS